MRFAFAVVLGAALVGTSATAANVFKSNFNDYPVGPFNPPQQSDAPTQQTYWYPVHGKPDIDVGPFFFKDAALLVKPDKNSIFNMFGYTTAPFAPAEYQQVLTIWEGVFLAGKTSIDFSLSFNHSTSLGSFLVRDKGFYKYGDGGKLVKIGSFDPDKVDSAGNLVPHSFIVATALSAKVPFMRVTFMQGDTLLRLPDIPIPAAKSLTPATGYLTLMVTFDKQDHNAAYVMHNVGINANFPKN